MLLSLALACVAASLFAAWRGEWGAAAVHANRRQLLRTGIHLAEAERSRVGLRQLAAAQEVGETAVMFGTNTVRAVHQGIASIPFGILERIPVTRGPTRLVRALHDSIAGGVYDSIIGVNEAVGSGLRKQLQDPADKPEPKP